MLKKIRERLADAAERSEGFTLIELMVVVLIIAILIAIAIPTFLGARERAQNRAAQSNLRNALTAEETVYTDGEQYSAVIADMAAVEGSIDWVAGAGGGWNAALDNEVQVTVNGTGSIACLSAPSKSGNSYAIKKIATGGNAGVYYQSAVGPAVVACDLVDAGAGPVWQGEFT